MRVFENKAGAIRARLIHAHNVNKIRSLSMHKMRINVENKCGD